MRLSGTDISVLCTAGIVLTSATYEWCYFLVVGVEFVSFISAGDFLPLVLSWLPRTLSVWLVAGLLYALLNGDRGEDVNHKKPSQTVGDGREHQPPRSSKWTEALRWTMYSLAVLSISLRVWNLLFSPSSSYLPLVMTILFWASALFGHRLADLTAVRHYELRSRMAIAVFPACLFLFCSFATSEAEADLAAEEGAYSVITKDGGPEVAECLVLRSLAAGTLVRTPSEDRIQFIPWDNIERLIRVPRRPTESRACRWFGVGCDAGHGARLDATSSL